MQFLSHSAEETEHFGEMLAGKLRPGDVWLQMAFTDENGNKLTVRKVQQPVEEFLKEAGYA